MSFVGTSVPDPFELMLACARATAERAQAVRHDGVSEVAALAGRVTDWDSALDAAAAHGLMPLVCREVLDYAGDAVSAYTRASLSAARVASAARALASSSQLAAVIATLDQAGVTALPYKGPSLAIDAYGDVTLRESDDLDIVVAPSDLHHAYRALSTAWYAPSDGRSWSESLAVHGWQGHVALTRISSGMVPLPVELHWRFCDRKLPWTLDVRAVMGRATTRSAAGSAVLIPDVHDQLVLVLLHSARHAWDRLEGVVCASVLLARGVDAETLMTRAREAGGVRACLVGLEVARRLLGARLPQAVQAAITRDGEIDGLIDVALGRLRAGDAGESRDARLHFASLDSITAKVRYVALAALLPTARDRDTVVLPRALSLVYVPIRLARLLARLLARTVAG